MGGDDLSVASTKESNKQSIELIYFLFHLLDIGSMLLPEHCWSGTMIFRTMRSPRAISCYLKRETYTGLGKVTITTTIFCRIVVELDFGYTGFTNIAFWCVRKISSHWIGYSFGSWPSITLWLVCVGQFSFTLIVVMLESLRCRRNNVSPTSTPPIGKLLLLRMRVNQS